MTATLSFFPVGNGDMTLIELDNGQTVLIDCNIRQAADNQNDDTLDVAEELKKRLSRDAAGRRYVSVMLLSHPDKDHCTGLEEHFHLDSPDSWVADDDKILISEMWSSPIVFRRASQKQTLVPDAQAWAREARRRVEHFRNNGLGSTGNRIKILGEDEDGKTDDLEEILVHVDGSISVADEQNDGVFDAQLLAPLAIADDEDEEEALAKNRSSVILRFGLMGDGVPDVGRYLTGGDAEVGVWSRLWNKHRSNSDILSYHLILSPHHCSWHSLSRDSWSELGEQAQVDVEARSALAQALEGAVVISSSKPIVDDDSDPPCIRAKREYISILDEQSDRFFCVGDTPNEVLIFEIGALGPQKRRRGLASVSAALGIGATSRSPRDHG